MPKVSIQNIENLQNESAAIGRINSNFQAVQDVIETLLSRDGTVPNAMVAILDMNNRRVLNLPVPISPQEPARHGDIQPYVAAAAASADRAENEADRSEDEADRSQAAADEAESYLTDLRTRYIGSYNFPPSTDPLGQPLQEGALYFNQIQDIFYVWTVVPTIEDPNVTVESWEPIPVNAILSMSDIIHEWNNGELVQWNTGQNRFIGLANTAENILYDDGVLVADNVQDAIDEILDRTTLGRYDLGFYIDGLLAESENLYRFGSVRTFTIPADTTGFFASAGVAGVDDTTITLRKNGVQFGTLFFEDGETQGVFTIPGDTVFNPGDLFSLTSPASVDTAFRDVTITLIARR